MPENTQIPDPFRKPDAETIPTETRGDDINVARDANRTEALSCLQSAHKSLADAFDALTSVPGNKHIGGAKSTLSAAMHVIDAGLTALRMES
jgi:hypothetical protein